MGGTHIFTIEDLSKLLLVHVLSQATVKPFTFLTRKTWLEIFLIGQMNIGDDKYIF